MTHPADLPHNEAARIIRLQGLAVLDTAPEAMFDNLVRAAADASQAPIALISLVDTHRQWFKANVGLPQTKQTPREVAFCAHAILQDDIFVVPDATKDPRFAANPLVVGEPNVRFYAGVPITLSGGFRLGTLCVMDRRPRRLSAQQKNILRCLADAAAQALEARDHARRSLSELHVSQAHFKRLFEATPAMMHSSSLQGRIMVVSDAWLERMGYRRDEVLGRLSTDFLTPASRKLALEQLLPEFYRNGRCSDLEMQAMCKDGTVIDILVSAYLERDDLNRPLHTVTVVKDISERKRAQRALVDSEARYRALVEDQSDLVSLARTDGVLTFVNRAYARHFGLEPEAMVGTNLCDYVAAEDVATVKTHLFQVLAAEPTGDVESQTRGIDGGVHWVAWTHRRLHDENGHTTGIHSVGRDITARKRVEQALRASEELLERTGQVAGVGGWVVDLPQWTITWSAETARMHDMPLGHRPTLDEAIDFYAPGARADIRKAAQDAAEQGTPWDLELPMVSAAGRPFWARVVGMAERREGRVVRLIGAIQDVTRRRQMEQELAQSHELLQVTLDSIGEAVVTTDAQGRVQWINPVGERLSGWSRAEAAGRPLSEVFCLVDEDTRAPAPDSLATCLSQGRAFDAGPHNLLIGRHGKEYAVAQSSAPMHDAQGQLLGAVLVVRDMSEHRRMSNEMSYRAKHDALTGLLNRSEFESRLQRVLARARQDNSDNALMYIDLDQFKLINDACGHSVGDQLLQQVGAMLRACVRSRDTVARLGGDEFGIILEHCAVEQAQHIAKKICDQMEDFRFQHENQRYRVGASIGLVPVDQRWSAVSGIWQAADTSCYAAKEAGRNRVHAWFDTDQAMRARHGQMQWVSRIEQALDEDHFELYAQRIVPIGKDSTGVHCEVLLRLREADGSIVGPGAFLPAVERFHLAPRVDRWVVRQVFDRLGEQADDAQRIELIAVNLSGQSIGDHAFLSDLVAMLRSARFDLHRLCFEITETAAVTNLEDAKAFIEEVRALGVKVALDDFGAGASSFGYLKNLPVDFLKIDGHFVTGLLDDALDNAAVRCFHEISRVVGVQTIAEFVESDAVLQALRDIGIDYAQGYLIHRPEPLSQVLGPSCRPPPVRPSSRPLHGCEQSLAGGQDA